MEKGKHELQLKQFQDKEKIKVEDLQHNLRTNEDKLTNIELSNKDLTAQLVSSQTKACTYSTDLYKLKTQYEESQNHNQTLNHEKNFLQKQIHDLNNQFGELCLTNQYLEKELSYSAHELQLKQLKDTERIKKTQEHIQALMDEKKLLREEIHNLTDQFGELSCINQNLQAKNGIILQQLEEAKQQIRLISKHNQQLQHECEDNKHVLENERINFKNVKDNMQSTHAEELLEANYKLTEAGKQTDEALGKCSSLERSKNHFKNQIRHLNTSVAVQGKKHEEVVGEMTCQIENLQKLNFTFQEKQNLFQDMDNTEEETQIKATNCAPGKQSFLNSKGKRKNRKSRDAIKREGAQSMADMINRNNKQRNHIENLKLCNQNLEKQIQDLSSKPLGSDLKHHTIFWEKSGIFPSPSRTHWFFLSHK